MTRIRSLRSIRSQTVLSSALTNQFFIGTVVQMVFVVDAEEWSAGDQQVVANATSELKLALVAMGHTLEWIAFVTVTGLLGHRQLLRRPS